MSRIAPAILASCLFMLANAASAASPVCERLQARLANLPTVISTDVTTRDYTGAISRQNLDLRQARSDRRRLGCSAGSIVVYGGDNQELCDGLNAEIDRMEGDLEALKARRQHLVSGGDSDVLRRRILAALNVNRCAEQDQEALMDASSEPETHRNILKDLPPISESGYGLRGSVDVTDFSMSGGQDQGGLRTLCVRTCDGAFFPISSSASPADFQRDTQACERRCPGAETELYYHALATEETEQMISAKTGLPYTDLPTAFAYKTTDLARPGQCGCAPVSLSSRGSVNSITTRQSIPDGSGIVDLRSPAAKAAPPMAAAPVVERPYDPDSANVRKVGPSFLPPQESAIDLKHPTGPGYQPVQSN